jgi:hypothetical protein
MARISYLLLGGNHSLLTNHGFSQFGIIIELRNRHIFKSFFSRPQQRQKCRTRPIGLLSRGTQCCPRRENFANISEGARRHRPSRFDLKKGQEL